MSLDNLLRTSLGVLALIAAAAGFLLLDTFAEIAVLHLGIFYVCTLCTLAALPYRRKSEVTVGALCVAASWEAAHRAAAPAGGLDNLGIDALGVVLAAAPVWVAHLRQLARGRFKPVFAADRGSRRRPHERRLRAWVLDDAARSA
jgi:hypothetical protein